MPETYHCRMRAQLICIIAGCVVLGCGGSAKQNGGGGSLGGDDSGSGSDDSGFNLDGGGFGGDALDGGAGGCPDELKEIYVLGEDTSLARFAPDTKKITPIGKINCGGGLASPNSMAVDRTGIAWVNYNDGSLWRVRVKDAMCTGTTFNFSTTGFTTQVGMAYVSNSPGSLDETLYVAAFDGSGVAKIDTTALTLSRVGSYGTSGLGAAELTGTGDARLFAFFQTSATVAPVDRSSGKLGAQKAVPGLVVGSAWAFAFWGGDFWMFADPTPGANSTVTQFDMTAGTASVVVPDFGFIVVGAGVSTCAPTTKPK